MEFFNTERVYKLRSYLRDVILESGQTGSPTALWSIATVRIRLGAGGGFSTLDAKEISAVFITKLTKMHEISPAHGDTVSNVGWF